MFSSTSRYFGRQNVSEFYLAGVADALRQHSKGEPKGIKAHFTMDESGLLFITNVSALLWESLVLYCGEI